MRRSFYMVSVLTAVTFLIALAPSVGAKRLYEVETGERIKLIRTVAADKTDDAASIAIPDAVFEQTGRLLWISRDSLALKPEQAAGAVEVVPQASIKSMYRYDKPRRYAIAGVVLGGLGGFAAYKIGHEVDPSNEGRETGSGFWSVLATGVGAVVGGIIGSAVTRETWERVELGPSRTTPQSAAVPNLAGIQLTWHF